MMHKPPKFRHRTWLLTLAAAAIAAATAATAATAAAAEGVAAEFQAIPELENLARATAMQELPPLTDHERMLVGPISPGMQLRHCGVPVTPVAAGGAHMRDRVTVELRCSGPTSWHIYVPVRIIGTSTVAVAAHAIVLGSVLTANDVRVEQRDLSDVPPGFLDDPANAVGLTAARPISGGAIITNQELIGAKAVQRGQSVTLLADAGGIQVRMAGRVLSDGLVNQRVKVQNLSSGKVVEGIARSEQVVEIILQ
jgi:flagella basal body P-ring formation protein FlgA